MINNTPLMIHKHDKQHTINDPLMIHIHDKQNTINDPYTSKF